MKPFIIIIPMHFFQNKASFLQKGICTLILCLSVSINLLSAADQVNDTVTKESRWCFHFQSTVINQYHPAFHSDYEGKNSLSSSSEDNTSITSTFYVGTKLWSGASAYYNLELSGGSGFSQTTGIAAFPNGEIYRVSDPAPQFHTARLFVTQIFPLSDEYKKADEDPNQVSTRLPVSYISVTGGKFSVMDFFDNNSYSHDPRTQFYNWALMGNGAWDYPADTRGYTNGVEAELVKPQWTLRVAAVMVPITANGEVMDGKILRSNSEALEFEHKYTLLGQQGTIRLLGYFNQARMGNYRKAIAWGVAHNTTPCVDSVSQLGNIKYGFGINIEQPLAPYVGSFLRLGWNDGCNETWAFTEIDRTATAGIQLDGTLWKRQDDKLGVALIADGLSKDHEEYLQAGGYGFIIGDGKLNYGAECIGEVYYSFKVPRYNFWISPDYQLVVNPAYNKDRGPVNIFGIRLHAEL